MKMDLPEAINVTLIYKGKIKELASAPVEKIVVSKDMPFIMLLKIIFDEYPKMMEEYPPGTLGLMLNDRPPTDFDIMHEGDVLTLITSEHYAN